MRKFYFKLGLAGGVVASLLGLAGQVRAYHYIEITSSSLASTTAYIGNLFSDVSVFVWLAIGLPLGFYVIHRTIGLVRGRART